MNTPNFSKFHTVEPIWEGELAYIVAGGISLKDAKLENLKGKNVIAVKRAAEHLPWASYYFSIDAHNALLHHKELIQSGFEGKKVIAVKEDFKINHAHLGIDYIIKDNSVPGLSFQPDRVRGYNSAFGALNYAILLGAKRICILGCDLEKKGYWFEPSSQNWINDRIVSGKIETRDEYIQKTIEDFEIAAQEIEKNAPWVTVYTTTPRLPFKYVKLDIL